MRLNTNFYQNDAITTAKALLGKFIVRKINNQKIIVKIVDTEAYLGKNDKASHAYNNKKTLRTETMFKKGGTAYVYLIYGIHYCFNIVTAAKNKPEAVLIRAVEPVKGLNLIKENRKIKNKRIENLTNGPGKLSEALKIDKSFDGINLITDNNLYLIDNNENEFEIESAKRVNIDYAEEFKHKKWRFYIKENKFISKS